jgi:hypothetical protein
MRKRGKTRQGLLDSVLAPRGSGVGAEARLIQEYPRAEALGHSLHFRNGMIAMWRRATDRTDPRAGEKDGDGLDPIRHPEDHTLSGLDATYVKIRSQGIGRTQELGPGDGAISVPHSDAIWRTPGMAGGYSIDRLVAPETSRVVFFQKAGIE